MTHNAEQYNFSDFTRDNYRALLRLAKQNYVFQTYTHLNKDERFILWRHDVDISIQSAVKLAQIEADENVSATYFLHLHSEFYNLLELEITNAVKNIIGFGHPIGLHFDSHYYNITDELKLEQCLLLDKKILEEIFEQEIRVFSFHITTPKTMSFNRWKYAGLINSYAEYFRSQVGYCSDSNGYWRFRRLEDVLREAEDKRLQVLTHPELWQETVMSPKQRVYRCIEGRAQKTKDWYDKVLKESGRENIDW